MFLVFLYPKESVNIDVSDYVLYPFLTLKQSIALSPKPGSLLLTTTCLLQHLCRQDYVWGKKKKKEKKKKAEMQREALEAY